MTTLLERITNDLEIIQGSLFSIRWLVMVLTDPTQPLSAQNPRIPLDLSTYTAEMQVRAGINSSAATLSFTTSDKLSVSSAGYVTLTLDGSETANVPFTNQWFVGVYDLRITDQSGATTCISEGQFLIDRAVTR